MRLSRLLAFAVAAQFVFGISVVANATTISAVGSSTVANGGVAPGSSTDYDFFSAIPSHLTNYTVTPGAVTTGGGFFGAGNPANYNQVTAPGGSTAFYSGIYFDNPTLAASDFLIATFSRSSAGDFLVYILDDNSDGNVLGNSSVGLSVNGGTIVSIATDSAGHTSEYSEFLVTGATTGDVFSVFATGAPSDRASVGGLTFDVPAVTPVPEPGTMLLSLTGIGSALAMARRRFM